MRTTRESFAVIRSATGIWEYAAKKDSPAAYRQSQTATGRLTVYVSRLLLRDRNGRKIERVSQVIDGDYSLAVDYVSTFPKIPSVRITSVLRLSPDKVTPTGIMVATEF